MELQALPRQHQRECRYHKNDPPYCSGKTVDGFSCFEYVSSRQFANRMPMCRHHRKQHIKAVRCLAPEPCGYACNTLIPMKPLPELQFCDEHLKQVPCYFLDRLPVELRHDVYSYLFAGRLIAGRNLSTFTLYSQTRSGLTGILRTNKQIYREACAVLYRQMQFGIRITERDVAIINNCHGRLRNASDSSRYYNSSVASLVATFSQCLLDLISSSFPSSSGSARSLATLLNPAAAHSTSRPPFSFWKNFPMKKHLWRWTRCFRLEIVVPRLLRYRFSPGLITKNLYLVADMVSRVVECIEIISPYVRGIDIIFNLVDISGLPFMFLRKIIEAIIPPLGRLGTMRRIKLYLSFTSDQEPSSMFDVIDGPCERLQPFVRDDASLLQEHITDWRNRIIPYTDTGSYLKIRQPQQQTIPRSALYQLEAALEVFYHPMIFSFVSGHEKQIHAAHDSAITAVCKQDSQAFLQACGQILKVLHTYSETQDRITRKITDTIRTVQDISQQPEKSSE